MDRLRRLKRHQQQLRLCAKCPGMQGPAVTGIPVISPIVVVGQAPGRHEIELRRPFAWSAGKTLFQWFASIGVDESTFRSHVYMAAVCRCYPGKNNGGGDRVPAKSEIKHCRNWLQWELTFLKPALLIPVGKLAISQFLAVQNLAEIIGKQRSTMITADIIPLPHPSGVSTWYRTLPGKTLLRHALRLIGRHDAWRDELGS